MKLTRAALLVAVLSLAALTPDARASDSGSVAGAHGPSEDGTAQFCYFAYHIVKHGPTNVQAGQDVTYRLVVRNIGDCDLRRIRVTDFMPRHSRLISANPAPSATADNRLIWNDVALEDGRRAVFEITVRPTDGALNRLITNTGCAFTPRIGVEICDGASTWVSER